MSRGTPHAPDVKATAIALLILGTDVDAIADLLVIPGRTVRNWRAALPEQVRAEVGQRLATKKKQDLGELIGEYLSEMLTTLAAHARHLRDETWLRSQNAHDIAILHGVLADKTFRLLAALESADALEVEVS